MPASGISEKGDGRPPGKSRKGGWQPNGAAGCPFWADGWESPKRVEPAGHCHVIRVPWRCFRREGVLIPSRGRTAAGALSCGPGEGSLVSAREGCPEPSVLQPAGLYSSGQRRTDAHRGALSETGKARSRTLQAGGRVRARTLSLSTPVPSRRLLSRDRGGRGAFLKLLQGQKGRGEGGGGGGREQTEPYIFQPASPLTTGQSLAGNWVDHVGRERLGTGRPSVQGRRAPLFRAPPALPRRRHLQKFTVTPRASPPLLKLRLAHQTRRATRLRE